jgi:DNA-binding MarR family transcriptional regulator
VVRTTPLKDLLGYALRRAQGAVYADLSEALSELDLRPLQLTLLLMVEENPGASQSGLCEALGIQKTNTVAAMGELERRGFIVRKTSSSDARSYQLYLTAKGKRFMQRAGDVVAIHEQRLVDRIGVDGRDQLLRLLGKLTDIK